MKKVVIVSTILLIQLLLSSCTLFTKSMDEKSGFSLHLSDTQSYVETKSWEKAKASMIKAEDAWDRLKPLIQIDVDHDYVNDIDMFFTSLGANIQTEDQSEALVHVKLIQYTWNNIGSL